MENIYKNIDKYNQSKGGKILIMFDDMIADINFFFLYFF